MVTESSNSGRALRIQKIVVMGLDVLVQLDDTGRWASVIPKLQTKLRIFNSRIASRSSLPASARTSGKDHL